MSDLNDIDELDLKIKTLELQKKALEHHMKQNRERKERTRLLIQTGALCEKYLPIKNMTVEERETFLKNLGL